ncbi:MAG: hypothetical protein R3B83_06035 [Nitrospirales bacterium]|nr:hypothetical protein [Nitrospirales bacterium]
MEWQHHHGVPAPKVVAQALVKKLEASVFKDKTYKRFALRPMEAGLKMPPKQAKQRLARAKRQGLIVEQRIRTGPCKDASIYKSISRMEPQGMKKAVLIGVLVLVGCRWPIVNIFGFPTPGIRR